ncbi:uncharacterized protein J7T54_007137 [Emericellopsis cladophorae]|uniref:Uncharacterized protein n=1 Tax=Emericellopsis cladophorae TaxID=2686198 RepID=A0A9Q0BID7_9HYPO|nr:uncharacterized protein J7T54_007137 [Emericellopsis cladophorae]KAI6785494.1 hypothetical protein J7T54_007137 [Emericellopsis cladophorae]
MRLLEPQFSLYPWLMHPASEVNSEPSETLPTTTVEAPAKEPTAEPAAEPDNEQGDAPEQGNGNGKDNTDDGAVVDKPDFCIRRHHMKKHSRAFRHGRRHHHHHHRC